MVRSSFIFIVRFSGRLVVVVGIVEVVSALRRGRLSSSLVGALVGVIVGVSIVIVLTSVLAVIRAVVSGLIRMLHIGVSLI